MPRSVGRSCSSSAAVLPSIAEKYDWLITMDCDEQHNPDWIPVMDSLSEPLAQIRRFASFRAFHDNGQFNQSETTSNGRLVGRSVWNAHWLLVIPGRTLLSDPVEGIERFVNGALVNDNRDGNGIKDIKIFFQTYSISGD